MALLQACFFWFVLLKKRAPSAVCIVIILPSPDSFSLYLNRSRCILTIVLRVPGLCVHTFIHRFISFALFKRNLFLWCCCRFAQIDFLKRTHKEHEILKRSHIIYLHNLLEFIYLNLFLHQLFITIWHSHFFLIFNYFLLLLFVVIVFFFFFVLFCLYLPFTQVAVELVRFLALPFISISYICFVYI